MNQAETRQEKGSCRYPVRALLGCCRSALNEVAADQVSNLDRTRVIWVRQLDVPITFWISSSTCSLAKGFAKMSCTPS